MPTRRVGTLIRGIAGRNNSGFAARAIHRWSTERFGGRSPAPREILDDDPEQLRTAAGLSHAEGVPLRSLAEHVLSL